MPWFVTGPLRANYACKASAHAYGHAGSMGASELAKAAGPGVDTFASRCLNLWRSSTKFSLKTYIFAARKIPVIDHCD